MNTTSKNLLLIFTRNPELGKCKTRLAADTGDEAALNIYKFLLQHTVTITKDLAIDKQVHYSVKVRENDIWDASIYTKKQQFGDDLGIRMQYAFTQGFEEGYERIIIIGSDMYDMNTKDLEEAFTTLEKSNFVIGPAIDGGYYLLGMTKLKPQLFVNKKWGTDEVLEKTRKDLQGETTTLLQPKNDIDYLSDLKGFDVFNQFLN